MPMSSLGLSNSHAQRTPKQRLLAAIVAKAVEDLLLHSYRARGLLEHTNRDPAFRSREQQAFPGAKRFLFEDNYLMELYCDSLNLDIKTARKNLIWLRDNPDHGLLLLKIMNARQKKRRTA